LHANVRLAAELRSAGISTAFEFEAKSMKSQMRSADRLRAEHVLILGENELAEGEAMLKKMSDGTQEKIKLAMIKDTLLKWK